MGFVQSSVVSRQSSATEGLTPPVLRGLTLVELLVVIVLISTLVTTAIPIISPGGEDRKLREASRNINAYFQGAQARAIETGRPFGVALRRLSEETGRGDDNAVVTQLEYVEVPAPYSGFDNSSLARVCVGTAQVGSPSQRGVRQLALQFVRYGSVDDTNNDQLPSGYDVDIVPSNFLRPGDRVQVGGSWYVITLPRIESLAIFSSGLLEFAPLITTGSGNGYFETSDVGDQYVFAIQPAEQSEQLASATQFAAYDLTPGVDLRLTHGASGAEVGITSSGITSLGIADGNGSVTGLPNLEGERYYCTTPAPFKIFRQPVPAGGESLELPNGIAIDLQASAFVNSNMTRLYQPSRSAVYAGTDGFEPVEEPAMVLFSPEGNVERAYLSDNRGATISSRITNTMALCVGRRELIPAERAQAAPEDLVPNTNVPQSFDEPIDLVRDLKGLTEDEQREITDKYNWLNLESRWVVIGAQSGSIRTVETSAVFVPTNADPANAALPVAEQLRQALEGVRSGTKAGGL